MKNTKGKIGRLELKDEENAHSFGKLKNIPEIYKGVKIPWGGYLLSVVTMVIQFALLSMSTQQQAEIIGGNITDFGIVITWAIFNIASYIIGIGVILRDVSGIKLVRNVQIKIWNKILHLPTSEYDKQSPNRLISRITNDAEVSQSPFAMLVGAVPLIVIIAFGVSGVPEGSSPVMLAAFGIGYLISAVIIFLVCQLVKKANFVKNNRLSIHTTFMTERIANMRLIKASCSEEQELARGKEIVEERFQANTYTAFAEALNELANDLAVFVVYISAFLVGAILLNTGKIADGSKIYYFYYFGQVVSTCVVMFLTYPTYFAIMVGQSHSFITLFKTESEDTLSGEEFGNTVEDIMLKNAGFAYEAEKFVISDVDCVIPAGKVTAILGGNGSGKSTLTKIVDRLYPLGEGSLTVGNRDAQRISLKSWREHFAMVSQNAMLFSGTIRDNILYGTDHEVSDEELMEIARKARLDNVLKEHPEGLDFDVGLAGSHLSGGEKQRVEIARAILKNPDYLILDDATANLDSKSERMIQEELESVMSGKTTIIIAHSPYTVKNADHVIVMEQGKVAAQGSPAELMGVNAYFTEFMTK